MEGFSVDLGQRIEFKIAYFQTPTKRINCVCYLMPSSTGLRVRLLQATGRNYIAAVIDNLKL